MNTLDAFWGESPNGKTEEYAKFSVKDPLSRFVLKNIVNIGQIYTLSFWVKADASGRLTVAESAIAVSTQWEKHAIVFAAADSSVVFSFQTAGTYYIYHPKLEEGNQATDWTPAPEDMATASDAEGLNRSLISVVESVAALDIKADQISASVTETQTVAESTRAAVNNSLETLTKEVAAKMTSEAVELKIQTALENGTAKVVTNTGFTFDDEGLMVEKSGSEMKTQITENGMTVYQNGSEVLTANNKGVDAKNLHATTYLIVGGRSRFENYGYDRTGCFWIGG